jgi:hypothetical protein
MVQIDPHALLCVRARNGRANDREGTAPSARSVGARRRKLDERSLERRADVLRGRRAARERVGGRLAAVVVVRVGVAVVLQLVQLAARAVTVGGLGVAISARISARRGRNTNKGTNNRATGALTASVRSLVCSQVLLGMRAIRYVFSRYGHE